MIAPASISRDQVIENYLPMTKMRAERYSLRFRGTSLAPILDSDSFMSAGLWGLNRAIDKRDPEYFGDKPGLVYKIVSRAMASEIKFQTNGKRHSRGQREIKVLDEDLRVPNPGLITEQEDFFDTLTADCSRKERLIMRLIYFEGMTPEEVGPIIGIGRTQVYNLKHSVENRMKVKLQSRRLVA